MFRSYLIIDHLRVMTRSPVDPNFFLAICLGWAPSGVLGYNSPPQKKNVSTRYHGPRHKHVGLAYMKSSLASSLAWFIINRLWHVIHR